MKKDNFPGTIAVETVCSTGRKSVVVLTKMTTPLHALMVSVTISLKVFFKH